MVPPPGARRDSGIDGWQGYTAIDALMKKVVSGELGERRHGAGGEECDQIVTEAMR